jgi:ABC-type Mn2+/Zn2+ transport system ATPase subunit
VTGGREASADVDSLVRAEGLSCAYDDGEPVIVDVDLCLAQDDFTGIVGPSGSGKTTLLRAVLGTLAPSRGTVWRQPGLRVGYVPQLDTVDWHFPVTVKECVLMARVQRRLMPWPSQAEKAEVDEVLDRLGIAALKDRHIRALSGGQQRRVFIARALLGRPHLLLLDEPTAGVDVKTRHEVLHLLGDLNAEGLTVAITTHDLNGIAAHLPYVVCLNRAVVGAGPPDAVLTPQVLEQTYGARMEVLNHGGMPVVVEPNAQAPAPESAPA